MTATYVVVADSSRAILFKYDKTQSSLTPLQTFEHQQGRLQDHELDSDHAGRQSNSAIGGSHGYGGDKSSHKHAVESFAAQIAGHLEQERNAGSYQQLVLVAPPQFLGHLRKQLSDACGRLVNLELNKNLVNTPPHAIVGILQEQRASAP